MDVAATLAGIKALPVDDRIRFVQAVWDTIEDDTPAPALTDAQKADLGRRLAELRENPDNVLTWDQIKAYVRSRK